MRIIQAAFFIKEDKRDAFLADILPLVESARQEEGCLAYNLYESVESKNQFVMIENWENQECVEKHNQNPLLAKLFGHMADYAAKKTELTVTDKED